MFAFFLSYKQFLLYYQHSVVPKYVRGCLRPYGRRFQQASIMKTLLKFYCVLLMKAGGALVQTDDDAMNYRVERAPW